MPSPVRRPRLWSLLLLLPGALLAGCGKRQAAEEPRESDAAAPEDAIQWWGKPALAPDAAPQPWKGDTEPNVEPGPIRVSVGGNVTRSDGSPAAGVRVSITCARQVLATVPTGADGRYAAGAVRLPATPTSFNGDYNLFVYAEVPGVGLSYPRAWTYRNTPRPRDSDQPLVSFQGEKFSIDLPIPATRRVAGRVADAAGRPIPGARVRVVEWDSLDPRAITADLDAEFHAQMVCPPPGPDSAAVSGPDGGFSLGRYPDRCGITLQVLAPGYCQTFQNFNLTPAEKADDPFPAVITLPATGVLRVRVTRDTDGGPAPYVGMVARFTGVNPPGQRVYAFARTGPDGVAQLHVPPGEYLLTPVFDAAAPYGLAWQPGGGFTATVPGPGREAAADIRVSPQYVLDVLVRDAETKQPVAGATGQLELKRIDPWATTHTHTFGPTRPDGKARFTHLLVGTGAGLRAEASKDESPFDRKTFLSVTAPGYETLPPTEAKVTVRNGHRDYVMFELKKK